MNEAIINFAPVTPAPAERPHHPLGPSSLQAVEACPHYMGRTGGSEAALMGTLQHGVTESGHDDNRLDDDRILHAAECIDFYESRLGALKESVAGRVPEDVIERSSPSAIVREVVEEYLPIDSVEYDLDVLTPAGKWIKESVKGTTAGYIDRALIAPTLKYAEAMDWKFGVWPVEHPSNNVQGMCYALGLFNKYPNQFDTITFYFKQPAIGSLKHHTWNRSDIPRLYSRIVTIVERAKEARSRMAKDPTDFSMANATIPNCMFCRLLGRCPLAAKTMLQIGRKFSPVSVPENLSPSLVVSGRDITQGLALAGLVKAWAESYRSAVTDRVVRGEADLPPGQKIVSTERRLVADADKFKAVALRYMTEAEFLATFTPEFGPTEKVIASKAPRGQKGAMVEQFGKALEEAGAVKKSAPVVFLRAVATEEKDK